MNEFLSPEKRQEATILVAGVALHALLSSGRATGESVVAAAFDIAEKFLKAAEALPK